jgi:hypothetical protein
MAAKLAKQVGLDIADQIDDMDFDANLRIVMPPTGRSATWPIGALLQSLSMPLITTIEDLHATAKKTSAYAVVRTASHPPASRAALWLSGIRSPACVCCVQVFCNKKPAEMEEDSPAAAAASGKKTGRPEKAKTVVILVRIGVDQHITVTGDSEFHSSNDHHEVVPTGQNFLNQLEEIQDRDDATVAIEYLIYDLIAKHYGVELADSAPADVKYGIPKGADFRPHGRPMFSWTKSSGTANSTVVTEIIAPVKGLSPVSKFPEL